MIVWDNGSLVMGNLGKSRGRSCPSTGVGIGAGAAS